MYNFQRPIPTTEEVEALVTPYYGQLVAVGVMIDQVGWSPERNSWVIQVHEHPPVALVGPKEVEEYIAGWIKEGGIEYLGVAQLAH